MATYEVEHGVRREVPQTSRPRRPDLSTFFSALSAIDTSDTQNSHAVPTPGDVSAAYRMLADAFDVMRRDENTASSGDDGDGSGLLDSLISSLLHDADAPPREVAGCPQDFLDDLDRIPKKRLKKDDTCPICNNPFLEDPYPLVVRLPCHASHLFDLECIQPWLKLNSTCPLDRVDLLKRREERRKAEIPADSEDEVDDMFA